MDAAGGGERLYFGNFRLEARAGRLFRRNPASEWMPVSIGPRALGILRVLLRAPGAVVSKDTIMDEVWAGVAVEPNNLTVQVAALRHILDEGRSGESCIQTVPGRGYRLDLGVTHEAEAKADPPAAPMAEPVAIPHDRPPVGLTIWHRRIAAAGAVAVVALLLVAVRHAGWLSGVRAPTAGTPVSSAAAQDRRQTVIVLPFENSSGDPAQDGLAAQMTRAITSKLPSTMSAIPEMTAAAYRGKVADLATIGRQHNVHFALTGTSRRQDGRLIVSAILYETEGGRALWPGHLDRPDGPDGEQAIVQSIYESVWQYSLDEEAARAMREHPNSLDKVDLLHMALSTRLATPTKAHMQEKIALIERALALDANDFVLLERQARLRADFVMSGYSSDPVADLAAADNAANLALLIQPNLIPPLRAKAFVLRAQGKWQEAEAVLRRVIGLQPTEANRHWELGSVLMAEGRHQEALESFETAKRLAGGSDQVYGYDASIAMAELALGRLVEATAMARLSLSEYPPNSGRAGEVPWLALIAAESVSGKDEAARADLQRFLAIPRSWHSMAEIEKSQSLAANPRLLDGLRRSGMPEQ